METSQRKCTCRRGQDVCTCRKSRKQLWEWEKLQEKQEPQAWKSQGQQVKKPAHTTAIFFLFLLIALALVTMFNF